MMSMRAAFNRLRRRVARRVLHALAFRIVFGESSQGRHLPMTRISPSTCIDDEAKLVLGDHVYIGPFNVIDASRGVTLDEGVQVTSHCAIVTHSSHRAQRLLGRDFVLWTTGRPGWGNERPGWVAGPVHVGAYSFIGPHSVLEAGCTLGRGTLVRAGSVVRGSFPNFAVLAGNPAQVVGDTRDADARFFAAHPDTAQVLQPLRDAWANAPRAPHDRLTDADRRDPTAPR